MLPLRPLARPQSLLTVALLLGTTWAGAQQTSPRITPTATQPGSPPASSQRTNSLTLPPGSRSTMPPATTEVGPNLTNEQKEGFLQHAQIQNKEAIGLGITHTTKLTLSDGHLTHAAHWQTIDIYKPVFEGKNGTVEKNFRDTYKFNIAAYRLAKLLHIENMVPPSVERTIDGQTGAITWWVDNMWMTELERRDKKIAVPADQVWVNQLNIVRVFDQLIYNTDRNQGNLLITKDWQVKMIDHTRAFRTQHALMNPNQLIRCDYRLLQSMKALTPAMLNRELGGFLRPEEIAAVLARRDIIVNFFQGEISKKGDFSVLTDIPRSTPNVVIP